jgi:hypothetical protein
MEWQNIQLVPGQCQIFSELLASEGYVRLSYV